MLKIMKYSSVYKFSLVPLVGGEQRVHLGSGDKGVGPAFGAGLASGAFPGAAPGCFLIFHKMRIFVQPSNRRGGVSSPLPGHQSAISKVTLIFQILKVTLKLIFQRFWRVIFYFLSGVSKFSVAVIPDGITNIANNLELHNYKSRLFAEKS